MVHQLNVIQIIKMDTPAVLFMDGVEIHQVILHKENSRCIHLKIYFNGEMIPNAGLIIQWEMVHQLNVTQIIKMDTPAVLFMYNDLVYFHTIHKENSRCIHLDDLDHIELVNHLPMHKMLSISS